MPAEISFCDINKLSSALCVWCLHTAAIRCWAMRQVEQCTELHEVYLRWAFFFSLRFYERSKKITFCIHQSARTLKQATGFTVVHLFESLISFINEFRNTEIEVTPSLIWGPISCTICTLCTFVSLSWKWNVWILYHHEYEADGVWHFKFQNWGTYFDLPWYFSD